MDKKPTPGFPVEFQIQDWQDVVFENSWANESSGTYHNAQYYKDPFDVVRLRGRIDSGSSGTVAFTLPVDYRPIKTLVFFVKDKSGNGGTITIANDGQTTITTSGGTPWIQLDEVTFRAEQ